MATLPHQKNLGFKPKEGGCFFKTLAQGERGFEWHFLEGLTSALKAELTGNRDGIINHSLRPTLKSSITKRSEVSSSKRPTTVDRHYKKYEQIINDQSELTQYTSEEKKQFSGTGIQSVSYYDGGQNLESFISQDNKAVIGVINLGVLPNRFFLADAGTVNRPYDIMGCSIHEPRFISYNTSQNLINNWQEFQQKIKKNTKYNEVMARVKWDLENSKISVHNRDYRSIIAALAFRERMQDELASIGPLVNDPELKSILSRDIPIVKHYKAQDGTINKEIISEQEIQHAKSTAISLIRNIFREDGTILANSGIKNDAAACEYEHFLQLNKEQMKHLLTSGEIRAESMFLDILNNRPYIAEFLILKYQKLCNMPEQLEIKFPADYVYQISRFSKTFTNKIINGSIYGLKLCNGKIPINGIDSDLSDERCVSGLDLSNIDLSKFDLSKAIFLGVSFNNSTLSNDIHGARFHNCDLRQVKCINLFKVKNGNVFDPSVIRKHLTTKSASNIITEKQLQLLISSGKYSENEDSEKIAGFDLMHCDPKTIEKHAKLFDITKNIFPTPIQALFVPSKEINGMSSMFWAIHNEKFNLARKIITKIAARSDGGDTNYKSMFEVGHKSLGKDLLIYAIEKGAPVELVKSIAEQKLSLVFSDLSLQSKGKLVKVVEDIADYNTYDVKQLIKANPEIDQIFKNKPQLRDLIVAMISASKKALEAPKPTMLAGYLNNFIMQHGKKESESDSEDLKAIIADLKDNEEFLDLTSDPVGADVFRKGIIYKLSQLKIKGDKEKISMIQKAINSLTSSDVYSAIYSDLTNFFLQKADSKFINNKGGKDCINIILDHLKNNQPSFSSQKFIAEKLQELQGLTNDRTKKSYIRALSTKLNTLLLDEEERLMDVNSKNLQSDIKAGWEIFFNESGVVEFVGVDNQVSIIRTIEDFTEKLAGLSTISNSNQIELSFLKELQVPNIVGIDKIMRSQGKQVNILQPAVYNIKILQNGSIKITFKSKANISYLQDNKPNSIKGYFTVVGEITPNNGTHEVSLHRQFNPATAEISHSIKI